MILAPRIIAVDDNLEHLQALEKAFDGLGGLCECIEFSRATSRTTPFVSGVRILFMDINLLPGAGAVLGPRTFSPIASIIANLISTDNGPYALVTWTENVDAHNALVDYLEINLAQELRPCATYCLPKAEHLEDPPALMQKIRELHSDLPGLAMLLDWEQAVTLAADRSVSEIVKLSGKYGRDQGTAVAQAVKAISEAAAGTAEAEEHPFRAFTQGMSGVLIDRLDHGEPVTETESAWKAALKTAAAPAPVEAQRAALNTFFHVEKPSSSLAASHGTIYETTFSALKEFLAPHFTRSRDALLSTEFLPIKGDRLKDEADKLKFVNSCKWRLIQLGAPCDHANHKIRVIDCLLGIEVPETEFANTNLKSKGQFRDLPARNDWLFQTPPFSKLGQGLYVVVFNLRYRIGLPLSRAKDMKQLGRLRDALANEIAAHSANFSTRPGIIEFR